MIRTHLRLGFLMMGSGNFLKMYSNLCFSLILDDINKKVFMLVTLCIRNRKGGKGKRKKLRRYIREIERWAT